MEFRDKPMENLIRIQEKDICKNARALLLDSSQGPTAAKYIMETVKPQRIAIIHDKQQYGEGLARSVQGE